MKQLSSARIMVYLLLKAGLIFFECSAFTGDNIDEAFFVLTKNILKKIEDGNLVLDQNNPFNKGSVFDLKTDKEEENKKATYCSSC